MVQTSPCGEAGMLWLRIMGQKPKLGATFTLGHIATHCDKISVSFYFPDLPKKMSLIWHIWNTFSSPDKCTSGAEGV